MCVFVSLCVCVSVCVDTMAVSHSSVPCVICQGLTVATLFSSTQIRLKISAYTKVLFVSTFYSFIVFQVTKPSWLKYRSKRGSDGTITEQQRLHVEGVRVDRWMGQQNIKHARLVFASCFCFCESTLVSYNDCSCFLTLTTCLLL